MPITGRSGGACEGKLQPSGTTRLDDCSSIRWLGGWQPQQDVPHLQQVTPASPLMTNELPVLGEKQTFVRYYWTNGRNFEIFEESNLVFSLDLQFRKSLRHWRGAERNPTETTLQPVSNVTANKCGLATDEVQLQNKVSFRHSFADVKFVLSVWSPQSLIDYVDFSRYQSPLQKHQSNQRRTCGKVASYVALYVRK